MLTHDEKIIWLDSMAIQKYTIRLDGIVDVDNNVDLVIFKGSVLPVQFGKVSGYFSCAETTISSLQGVPQSIGGSFGCYKSKILSLHNIHNHVKHIGKGLLCGNYTTHLLGLLLIDGIIIFNIDSGGPIDKIFNKYVGTGDIISAQDELIDAGFIEQARL
jgi:hypothetical protein